MGKAIKITGVVQGVGFRPFVYRLARQHGLVGWVRNGSAGVEIEVDGSQDQLAAFVEALTAVPPPLAQIDAVQIQNRPTNGFTKFQIIPSQAISDDVPLISPDIATCPDCLRELFDPSDHRYRYPFINCTNCGPRFTIIEAMPYDRPHTSMKSFPLCADCQHEYSDPANRRFHAQPNACPVCGPQLELWAADGAILAERDDALRQTAAALQNGLIVAVKGIGGFHLITLAHDETAVATLRQRKQRPTKPFALLYPNLATVQAHCHVSDLEARLLTSPEAPIVILARRTQIDGAAAVLSPANNIAPRNPTLGVMLPSNPLHHLLLADLGIPLVATSGNLSDEPICIDEQEALERLHGIADLFLVHNRPIVRHVDDSIVRQMAGREMILRRARGYAPLPVPLPQTVEPTLAVGAHLKNSAAVAVGDKVFLSQHIGDLETVPAYAALERVAADLQQMLGAEAQAIACDLHPDFFSTKLAEAQNKPLQRVQHHYAHVLSCLADNRLQSDTPALGISWDGTGYGEDGTVWGGEFLQIGGGMERYGRIAHFRTFPLLGGDQAAREPRRAALGLLAAHYGGDAFQMTHLPSLQAFNSSELKVLQRMWQRGLNCPQTNSVGRLFDAVASLLGLHQHAQFEGEAAMALEFALTGSIADELYRFDIKQSDSQQWLVDWGIMLEQLLLDISNQLPINRIAAKFHRGLTAVLVKIAQEAAQPNVLLTGGCFQNKFLLEQSIEALRAEGFTPVWHQHVPPNDGGIALGQIAATL